MLLSVFTFVRDTSLANRTSNECIGLQKRYRLCNEQVKYCEINNRKTKLA